MTAVLRSPGSHRLPGDNGFRDAPLIDVSSVLALSFAALSFGGVWAIMLYGTPSKLPMFTPAVLQTGVVESPTPLQASLPSGFCSGSAVLALVRPVVPYTLALSSRRSRPVPRPVILDVLALLSRCY